MLAARQLSTLAQAAPGRLTLGIGVAGEDRREAAAADLGRESPSWFGVNVWCGLDADPGRGREMLAAKMERL
jgi:alkanesulfonate monooxygenase SsuD/methylene tetrahydromethanopterin reductase-like flavin-dependent oxidoreductase (luciferase family)